MLDRVHTRLTYAYVTATVARFAALGGGAPKAWRVCAALLAVAAAMAVSTPADASSVWVPRPPTFVAKTVSVLRYASPGGSSSALNPCDDSENPCALRRAIASASTGDEVVVEPGDYFDNQPIDLDTTVYLHGVWGQPRPRILSSAYGGVAAVGVVAPNTRVRYIAVHHTGRGILLLGTSDTVQEVVSRNQGGLGQSACEGSGDGQKFIDTLCVSAASCCAGQGAVSLTPGSAGARFYLRNVTAVGSDAGLSARGACCGASRGVEATVVNTIVRGGRYDVFAQASSPSFAKVYLSYSNYDRSHSAENDNSLVWNAGNNQSTLPMFVNAQPTTARDANGDYHEVGASPTRNAGQTDAANGPFDFEGDPRTFFGATDIGADEFIPPQGPTSIGPPRLSSASLSYGAFAADPIGPAAKLTAVRRAALGTIINYTLSKRARILFTITGARSRLLGRFAQAGRPGPNSKPWSGKLGKNRLSAGTYRVTLEAVDSRGRRSRPKPIGFKVVHP